MPAAPSEIEAIVQEVLRRLLRASSSPPQDGAKQSARAEPAGQAGPATLRLTDRVVSLAQLTGRLDGIQNVLVLPQAVVTPAAHDELRQRGIRWARCAQLAAQHRPAPWLVAATRDPAARELADRLVAAGRASSVIQADDEQDAARKLNDQLPAARRALLLARRPFAAVQASAAFGELRAAYVRSAADVRQARHEVDANVLVIAAGKMGLAQLCNCLVE